ncbi:MAG: helix-turn-helix transcriptional regulator [Clostridiales bacterium]|nr:helix-turn-helix transcriptional regulator [Clostridiales bacterium]
MQQFYELTRDQAPRTYAWRTVNNQFYVHFHSTVELIYVEEGILCTMQNGVVSMVGAGQLVVNSSYIVHSYSTPEYSRIIVATIPLSAVPSLRTVLSSHRFNQGIVDARRIKECRLIMRMMADTDHSQNVCFINSLAEALLALLIDKIGLSPSETDKESDLTKRIVSYLQENAAEEITVESVAAHFGYSVGRFSHIFNKQIGSSFTRYLNNIRCRMAQRMLEAEDLPIIDVAHACGFGSVRTFHRVYKECIGKTPRSEQRVVN